MVVAPDWAILVCINNNVSHDVLASANSRNINRRFPAMVIFICQFCSRETTNAGANRKHEISCKSNPNPKRCGGFVKGSKIGVGENQYTKAKKLGLDPPVLSDKTKKLLSEKTTINNLNRSAEINRKISVSMKKAHLEGRAWNIGKSRWNNEPSYPEKFFKEVIKNEFSDKNYENEYPIGIYSADFCWPHLKKVIEIDGDQHQRFEEYIERDKRKDNFLTLHGYQVFRVVWKEMYNNPKDKIAECYKFIHSQ